MESKSRIAGLILAAGYSSRMGAFKPLLTIGDITALERVSAALKGAGIKNIIGVTGYQRELLAPVLASEGITEAHNPDFERGMFTSIQAGIRKALRVISEDAMPPGIADSGSEGMPEGFFIMPVDCPLVPDEVIANMVKKHQEEPNSFIVPCYRGKKGHPLFIPGQYAEEILEYQGEGGLKAITNRHEDKLIRLEADTEAVVLDMDTTEGYEEVLEFYGKQSESKEMNTGCEEELRGKRLFLIRHGEIRQHSEKIFIGQTDVPLSNQGMEQSVKAVEKLKQYGIAASRIYTSDLSRAVKTAEIIRDGIIPNAGMINNVRLREMSLGEWDGRFISEIREKYPDEYQKRGEKLLTYKCGADSENFYDLQYRVMKGLRSILKQEREAGDDCRDIVIVSHLGVINVILSNLNHTDLDDQIRNFIPNSGFVVVDFSGTPQTF